MADGASPNCKLESGPRRTVASVVDGATLRLDDGSEVRLLGLLPPYSPDEQAVSDRWPPELQARAALAKMVQGRDVDLAFAGRRSDRYGRMLAHAFVARGGERVWVQGEMLANGHARAYASPDPAACLGELLSREDQARSSGKGLWASAAYAVLSPYEFKRLWRLRSTYHVVEGSVAEVEVTSSAAVLKLTTRTRLSFRVRVPLSKRQNAGPFEALLHKRIRARGWIEWRQGPGLTVADPALIEAISPRR